MRLLCNISALSCRLASVERQKSLLYGIYVSTSLRRTIYKKSPVKPSEFLDEPVYPPVKPKYPPEFHDESLPFWLCWRYHGEAEEMRETVGVKWRLEKQAGTEPKNLIRSKVFDLAPNTLGYKLYTTKTHIVQETLPEFYSSIDTSNVVEKSKQTIISNLDCLGSDVVGDNRDHYVLHSFLNGLLPCLAGEHPHLMTSQVDDHVRVETFWRRGGYGSDDTPVIGEKFGLINIQFKNIVNLQVRTEQGLKEILPLSDEMCSGTVDEEVYSPKVFGQGRYHDRPVNVAGYWIGDPCPNLHLSIVALPHDDLKTFKSRCGPELTDAQFRQAAVTLGFATSMSMAMNQGYNYLLEIPHPVVSQVVIAGLNSLRLCTYQLNTTRLWLSDAANPRRNLAWISPSIDILQEDGQPNQEAIQALARFLLHEPTNGEENIREKIINHIGEPEIERPKIGRFEYPRNAVYF